MEYWYSMAILYYWGIKNLVITKTSKARQKYFQLPFDFQWWQEKKAEFSLKTNCSFKILPQHIIAYTASLVFNIHDKPQMPFLATDVKGS